MTTSGIETLANAWTTIFAVDALRYLLPASLFYGAFWTLFGQALEGRWLRAVPPQWRQIRRELAYSLSTVVIFSMTGLFSYAATSSGATRIYPDVDRFGHLYAAVSLVVTLFAHDAYFYWTHRLMHHPRLFPHVHRVHHLSQEPSPWAAYAFHPWEAVAMALFLPS